MNYYEGSAGSYSSNFSKDNELVTGAISDSLSDVSWSISNTSENEEDLRRAEEEEGDERYILSQLKLEVVHNCSVCGVSTDKMHLFGCPYSDLVNLYKHYSKST